MSRKQKEKKDCNCVYKSASRNRARMYIHLLCCMCMGGMRPYPRRIKESTETRLKNHDARVRAYTSVFFFLIVHLFQFSARFAALASRHIVPPRGFKSVFTPKQLDFLLRAPMRDDDILFRVCYANRELSNARECRQNKCGVSLGRLRKISCWFRSRTVHWSSLI